VSLSLRFLGTAASRPTVERNVAGLAVVRDGDTLLFDCGEGTQRQMMRYGVSFSVEHIFFTHFHTDHYLGVIGLLRTMSLNGRTDPLRVYGPRGATKWMNRAESLGMDRLSFPIEVRELSPDEAVRLRGYEVRAFAAEHRGTTAVGYVLIEDTRLGRFHPDLARAAGVPEGPLWGRLHRGETVSLDDGTVVDPARLVGGSRPGRCIAITGDTRPAATTVAAARDADLLVHEATFAEEEAVRAVETGHSTAREAAAVARDAGVRRLVLTHFSARYSRDAGDLLREARELFGETVCARDGLEIIVGHADEGDDAALADSAAVGQEAVSDPG